MFVKMKNVSMRLVDNKASIVDLKVKNVNRQYDKYEEI